MYKKLFSLLILLSFVFVMNAQDFVAPRFKSASPNSAVVSSVGISGTTAMLVADLMHQKDLDYLRKQYPIVEADGTTYVSAFVETESFADLSSFGIKTSSEVKQMATALIPLDNFLSFVQSGCCQWVDVGAKARIHNDIARTLTHVDQVHAGMGIDAAYDGTDVVVGIIDIGFEYGHPTFYDSLGTTLRIKRVWNQDANYGSHPAGYSYGVEYATESAILNAQYSHNDETHGSHVAGIACGSGGKTAATRQYKGMAPNADIVLVATNMEETGIYDGITYIADYARSVGKPCVINMSIGSHIGPHDGTSTFDRQTLAYTNAHPAGLLLVGACGNEGSDNLHVSKTFSAADTALYTLMDLTYAYQGYPGYADIWGAANTDFRVGLAVYNTSTGQYVDQSYLYSSSANNTYEVSLNGNNIDIQGYVYCMGRNQYNNKPEIALYLEQSGYSYYSNEKLMVIITGQDGVVHAWGTYATFDDGGINGLTMGNSEYTVGEVGGSGEAMISVGSYQSRGEFTDIIGRTTDMSYGYDDGDISYFSSIGPTVDGRTKPEITAPGQLLISAFNRFDNSMSSRYSGYAVATETFGSTTEWWGALQGTSMASPTVCGIMALWLQANPSLTIAQAKQMIKSSAITDSFTGAIPAQGDNFWGWGKINALGGFSNSGVWYTVTASSNNEAWGTVSGAGSYPENSIVSLTAVPAAGCSFVSWSNGSTANPYTFTLTSDVTINATFSQNGGICESDADSYQISVRQGSICIIGMDDETLTVMDVMGRVVVSEPLVSGRMYSVPTSGVYMVKVGQGTTRKVVVTK